MSQQASVKEFLLHTGTLLILCTDHLCNEEAKKEVQMRTEKFTCWDMLGLSAFKNFLISATCFCCDLKWLFWRFLKIPRDHSAIANLIRSLSTIFENDPKISEDHRVNIYSILWNRLSQKEFTYVCCFLMQSIHSLCAFHPVLQPQIFWFLGPYLKRSCRTTKWTFSLRYLSHWTGFVFVGVRIKKPFKKWKRSHKRASSISSDSQNGHLKSQ